MQPPPSELLLANILPTENPGRHQLAVQKSDLDLQPEWNGGWNRSPTPGERVEQFFSRPRPAWGEILCYSGPFLDNRTDGVQGFFWMDFARDGRYYVREDDRGYTATLMTSDQFANHIKNIAWRVGELASRR